MLRTCARAWIGLAISVACATATRTVAATEPSSSFRLAWARGDGADACVDEPELERRVRARLGRNPFGPDADQSIEGTVARSSSTWRAELRVRDRAGALIGRRELAVAESDCRKLTDAIVLAIALAIDPRASLAPSEPSADSSSPAPSPPEPSPDPSKEGAQPDPKPAVQPCPAPVCPPQRACPLCRTPVGSTPPNQELGLQATLRALGTTGLLPKLAPGLAVSAAAGSSRLRFTAGLSYFPEQETSNFAFGLSTADLGACVSPDPIQGFLPSLCGQLQVGAMHAVVRNLEPLRPGDHAFAALALGPQLGVQLISALFVEAGVFGVVPVLRPRFALRGEPEPVFESQKLGALGFLGVGLRSP